ncbi:MAG TPA: dihydrodipicolinate synthase family protein [Pseudonocardiaceae bacterium]|nr:dihydrodipicolinate synthase family protein [Pseudonocardiaceae bacterium]
MVIDGVVPPLCTPLTADGDLDRRSLARLCEFLLAAGVDGLFIGGSTGEVALLSDEHREAALAVAVEVAAGAVPVLYGVIDTSTVRSIARARRGQDLGATAIVATAPFYVSPHPDEMSAHFRLIRSRVDVPLVAYDIPSAVHVKLRPSTVVELAKDGVIAAIKDSSGDFAGFRAVVDGTKDLPFQCLTGSELFADMAIASGGHGLVPGLGNIDPHGYIRLYRAARAGDLTTAAAEQRRLARLFAITEVADRGRIGFTAAALGSFKAALKLRGIIDTDRTSPPLAPLTDDERTKIRTVLAAADLR